MEGLARLLALQCKEDPDTIPGLGGKSDLLRDVISHFWYIVAKRDHWLSYSLDTNLHGRV